VKGVIDMLSWQALFEPAEEGGFVVTFPDLGHGATQGETEEGAMEMAADFLSCVVSDYIAAGEQLPEPKKHRGRKYRIVQLPALAAAKAELYRAFLASGVRKADLARRLGTSKGNIDRLFDLNHSTRIEQLEAAFRAIGKRMDIEIHEAA
jgi:antitoxin HicB